ncbi:hypothetical protein DCC79_10675 [bacterium]|nr:hypothetical protein [Chloroflexi bacterium CFX6]RIL09576.1 MAG: hypothetical protein DCC79_10675 [bacterium]
MPDFLDKLTEAVRQNERDLARHLQSGAAVGDLDLQAFIQSHWNPLPPLRRASDRPAYAVDGSIGQVDLDNGCHVVVAQSLCLGDDGFEETSVDVRVLPPATPRASAARFADVFQRHRELFLACETVNRAPAGSILFLDGALYGILSQLYPTYQLVEVLELQEFIVQVLDNYLYLLNTARERGIRIIAVSKTSREATHCKIWMRAQPDHSERDVPDDVSDSNMIHRWTDGRPGVSEPVVLGSWGFTGSSADLLDRPDVKASPAIVSFFVRLADFDDALRIDIPAHQAGSAAGLADVRGELLDGGVAAIEPTLEMLAADYGGLEVYNALLYSVDREVRLKRGMFADVYLPLIGEMLGCPLRPNRSERRFV